MPRYKGTMTVTRVQDYEFIVTAATKEEAAKIMDSPRYWEDKEELAVNDWDSAQETIGHEFSEIVELPPQEGFTDRYVLRRYVDESCTEDEYIADGPAIPPLVILWDQVRQEKPGRYFVEDINTDDVLVELLP